MNLLRTVDRFRNFFFFTSEPLVLDVAIGAPSGGPDNKGAVYIYNGRKDGIHQKASQVCVGRIQRMIKTFHTFLNIYYLANFEYFFLPLFSTTSDFKVDLRIIYG